jgi:hypothetical protein
MFKKKVLKSFEDYIQAEGIIKIEKKPGRERSAMFVNGDSLTIQVMLCSFFEMLMKENVFTEEDLKDMINMAVKGGNLNDESK